MKKRIFAAAFLLLAGLLLMLTGCAETVKTLALEITPPAPGQAVPTELGGDTGKISWSAVRWNDTDTGAIADYFEPGHQYSLTVYGIAPKAEMTFADDISVTINGKACRVVHYSEAGEGLPDYKAGDAYGTISASVIFDRLPDGTMITVHGTPVSKNDYLDDVFFTLDNCGSADVPELYWSKPSGSIELGEQFLPGCVYTAELTYPLPEGVHLADENVYIYVDAPGSTASSTVERDGKAVTAVTYTVAPVDCLITITNDEQTLANVECAVTVDGTPVKATLSCTVLAENGDHEMLPDEGFHCDNFDPETDTGMPQYRFTVRFPANVDGPDGISVEMAAPYKIASKTVSETDDGMFVTVTTVPTVIKRGIPVVIEMSAPVPNMPVATEAPCAVTVDGAPVDALAGWAPVDSARTPETEAQYTPGVVYRGEAAFTVDRPDYRFWLDVYVPEGFRYGTYERVTDIGNNIVYSVSFYYTIPEPEATLEVSAGCVPLAGMKREGFDPAISVTLTDLDGRPLPFTLADTYTIPETDRSPENGNFQPGSTYRFLYPLTLPETVTSPWQIACTMPGSEYAPVIRDGSEPGKWKLEVTLTAADGLMTLDFDPVPAPGINASDVKVTATYGWPAGVQGGAGFPIEITGLEWDETDGVSGILSEKVRAFEAGKDYRCFIRMTLPAEIGELIQPEVKVNAGMYIGDPDFDASASVWTDAVWFLFDEDGTLADHVHNWTSKARREATCKRAGEETFECTVCHKIKTETSPKLSHKIDTWAGVGSGQHAGKCEVCGEVILRNCTFRYESSFYTHTKICTVCGDSETVDHYDANRDGYCDACRSNMPVN